MWSRKIFEKLGRLFRTLRALLLLSRRDLIESIERIATGSIYRALVVRWREYRLKKLLDRDGLSVQVKREHDRLRQALLAQRYSRSINSNMKATLDRYHSLGIPFRVLRLLVANKLIDRAGVLRFSKWKDGFFCAAGTVYIFICFASFMMFAVAIGFSGASYALKITWITVFAAFFLLNGFMMSLYSVVPYLFAKRVISTMKLNSCT